MRASMFRSSILLRALLPSRMAVRAVSWRRWMSAGPATNAPATKISELRLPPACIKALSQSGITELTPIQDATMEHLRLGEDVIARAKTGSGKTLAFLLPMLEKLTAQAVKRAPGKAAAIIIEPTRELVIQVGNVLEKCNSGLRVALIYGGASYETQQRAMRYADVVIGTPGRLRDMYDRKWISFDAIESLVIDEADRLLDMGFGQDVTDLISFMPKTRQSIVFSATMPEWCHTLVKKHMKPNCVTVDMVSDEAHLPDASMVPSTVRHVAVQAKADPYMRHTVASAVIKWAGGGRSLVFVSTQREVDDIASAMPKTCGLHGGMRQQQRERVLAAFRRGSFQTMVATDVCARGIDITDIKTVIQLRPHNATSKPLTAEDYVHRAGRVGRAGQTGTSVVVHYGNEDRSLTLLSHEVGIKFEKENFTHLEPTPRSDDNDAHQFVERNSGGGGGGERRSWEARPPMRSSGQYQHAQRPNGRGPLRSSAEGSQPSYEAPRRSYGERAWSPSGSSSSSFGGSSFAGAARSYGSERSAAEAPRRPIYQASEGARRPWSAQRPADARRPSRTDDTESRVERNN